MSEIRITVKAARINAGIELREAAKKLGISIGTLGNYEAGRTSPKMEIAARMSELYNIPIDNLSFLRREGTI